MSIILRTNMCELKPTNSNELQIEFVDEENISNNEKGGNKKKLKEILKRVYIGIYEDSKNILLLKNTGITHLLKKIILPGLCSLIQIYLYIFITFTLFLFKINTLILLFLKGF
ncbi:hypothetical protein [Plasmodium yoelii yoelii]|uniref:Uncharacterized protein n=1 Tax=Plasmodium yoelii yoelii TaxID=73239 RepID=Q7RB18_PLAYO|nr:hypothetical protein [Plasmodium yoelii yoelii]